MDPPYLKSEDMNAIQSFLILVVGFLMAAAIAAFALLKAYRAFRKGIEKNNSLFLWESFFIVAFLFIVLTFAIVKGLK